MSQSNIPKYFGGNVALVKLGKNEIKGTTFTIIQEIMGDGVFLALI